MNSKISKASLYGIFAFAYMSAPIMLYFGMPLIIPYLLCVALALFCLFFSEKGFYIRTVDVGIISTLIGIALIDKVNDVLMSEDVESIIPFLFAVVMVFVVAKSREYADEVWGYVTVAASVSLILLITSRGDLLFGGGESKLGSGIASYIYVIFAYIWLKSGTIVKYAAIPVLLLAAFYFQSRSAQVAIVLFVASDYFLKNSKYPRAWLWIYLALINLAFAFVIHYEINVVGGISSEFTGRGVIWATLLNDIKDSVMFGVANVSNESRIPEYGYDSDAIAKAIASADPHNGLLYILYNSGLVGLSLFYLVLHITFNRIARNRANGSIFIGAYLIYAFEGSSLYGVSLSGIVLLVTIFVPLNRSFAIEYIRSSRNNRVLAKLILGGVNKVG